MSAENPRGKGSADGSNDSNSNSSSVECPTCNRDDFKNEHGMRIHHSQAHDESIAGVTYECDWCGEEMQIGKWRLERSEYITCSRECSDRIRSKHYSGENHGSWEGGDVTVECAACGETKEVGKARSEKYDRFYCSTECESTAKSERYSKEGHPIWEPNVETECGQCGEVFDHPKWDDRTFCSKECELDWRSDTFSGEGNPAWEGGYDNYYGPTYSRQRRKARERDDYECQVCGVPEEDVEGELHTHHIIPFKDFEDSEEANKASNLIVLCEPCHNDWEGLYLRPDTR